MIKLLNVNLFDDLPLTPYAIMHGCNCFNSMGAGFAKYLAWKFPSCLTIDQMTVKGDRSKLGLFSHTVEGIAHIYNLYSQYTFFDKSDMFYLDKFESALMAANEHMVQHYPDIKTVYTPLIGAGLAHGNVKDIMQATSILKIQEH